MSNKKLYLYFLVVLVLIALVFILATFFYSNQRFKYIACNVGQGDATLLQIRNTQILVDGGPSAKVLECLGTYMPFFDREIELVILTHPQSDHYSGLIDVVKRYKIKNFMANTLKISSQDYQLLESLVGGGGTKLIVPTDVSRMRVGLLYLDILHPDKIFYDVNTSKNDVNTAKSEANTAKLNDDVSDKLGVYETKKNLNDFSIVAKISYKNFDVILTGDIEPSVIDYIFGGGRVVDVEVLKVPHHGSKNGLNELLLLTTKPELATISVGKNQWGHPNKETLDILSKYHIKTYRTDEKGNIVVETDGDSYSVK